MNVQLVIDALTRRPDLSAADDGATAAALNTPVHSAKSGRLTLASLADAGAWGFAKTAAFRATLEAVAASGGPAGATAGALLDLLKGPGFNLNDPQVSAMAPAIVALSNGVITEDDATAVLFDTSYPCGTPDVAAADVALARKVMAFEAKKDAAVNATIPAGIQAIIGQLDELHRVALSGESVTFPTPAQMAAWFQAAIGG
jgi:hypothetical protein